jgi:hypothetical protein
MKALDYSARCFFWGAAVAGPRGGFKFFNTLAGLDEIAIGESAVGLKAIVVLV